MSGSATGADDSGGEEGDSKDSTDTSVSGSKDGPVFRRGEALKLKMGTVSTLVRPISGEASG